MVLCGIDIGGTKCAVSLGKSSEENINILSRREISTPHSQSDALNSLAQIAKEMIGTENISGIGISAGNPMDAEKGELKNPPNLPGWYGISLTQYFSERLGAPALLENDANACALAEYRWGAGKGSKYMVFITFGTGFGAGVIVDGQILRGACGNLGELGHWRISEHGPSGYGKIGSLEGFCSGGGIAKLASTVAEKHIQIGITPSYYHDITAKSVAQAAFAGDKAAIEVYDISGRMLGKGLSLLIDFFNPDRIVIGSIYARSHQLLENSMREELIKECLSDSYAACKILPAQLGDSIGDYAALAIAQMAACKKI